MTAQEAISYISNCGWSTTKLGLERTRALLASLGDPQKALRFVHVAGSNGKGSTCAMLASVLSAAGFRTGLYISPYIQTFEERIQIDGAYIPGDRLAEITDRVRQIADAMDDHPSQFELITAIAMEYYREENCDIVVLEVGMGGSLDSTNAIDAPEVAVLVNIGLDHTEYLGDTLEEIAETKAGIIKTGCDAVCYQGDPGVTEVIRRICQARSVPLFVADFQRLQPLASGIDGQVFLWRESGDTENKDVRYELPLLGRHQLRNASVVLTTIEALRRRGWRIPEEAVRRGLACTSWPARFEVLAKEPLFILDGGHNPQCAEALVAAAKDCLPARRVIFLLGVLADKDYTSILDLILPIADEIFCLTPRSKRAMPAEDLAEIIRRRGKAATGCRDYAEGIQRALEASDGKRPVIAFGSLYAAGFVRTEFPKVYKAWLRKRLKAVRKAIPDPVLKEDSASICRKILSLEAYRNASVIFLYRAVHGEVQLDLLEREAEADGKVLCYPCWDGTGMTAVTAEQWEERADGFLQPDIRAGMCVDPSMIDLVVCPVLGFDASGRRLGMGGGYYDRYLPRCTSATVIGVAFSCQEVPLLPAEEHDVLLSGIISEL